MSLIGLLLGWTGLPQWACEAVAVLLVACGAVGAVALYNHHERSLGAAKCVASVQKQTQAQESHNAVVHATDEQTVQHEAQTYAQATAAPVIHPVRVYFTAPRPLDLPAAPAASVSSDEAAGNGGSDHGGSVPPQSFGPELQALGHDADAQIAGLQDYITKVCRPAAH